MATILTRVRRTGRRADRQAPPEATSPAPAPERAEAPPLDIAPNDPLLAYLQSSPGPVDVDKLQLDSVALEQMRSMGLRLVVPLVAQGELIGLLNLGPRLSEQEYSTDDRKLLENLAAQAAPAVRVAQLVREQEAEARRRERVEHELQVAQLIQQNFLPKTIPDLPGWQLAAYYQPQQAVGGDFYDFIELPEGQMGLVIGDVTDKGVPAALVMAATRSVLRAAAPRLISPNEVLRRVNDILCPDMPPNMFVTCLYGVLDPSTGHFRYANAGHNLPYTRTEDGVVEFRATGLPLGLMPDMSYDEKEAVLGAGETMLLSSDGLVEAHSPDGEMFGFPRLRQLMAEHPGGSGLLDHLLSELRRFVGPGWDQEDDVTLVTLWRASAPPMSSEEMAERGAQSTAVPESAEAGRVLAEFSLPSVSGNERLVMDRVAEAVADVDFEDARRERLKTAVSEAAMNAIEHGNGFQAELPVAVVVTQKGGDLSVRITDHGGGRDIPEAEVPDLDAKLEGKQTPRGWGLFLIKNMVDEMHVSSDDTHHTIELVLHLEGGEQ
ncbi:MAG: SpoIIE family protein phosphatase [Actinomycetota bacterium]|nr:SpoIIE family protein phosphatase [Actinomycetota bacterium]